MQLLVSHQMQDNHVHCQGPLPSGATVSLNRSLPNLQLLSSPKTVWPIKAICFQVPLFPSTVNCYFFNHHKLKPYVHLSILQTISTRVCTPPIFTHQSTTNVHGLMFHGSTASIVRQQGQQETPPTQPWEQSRPLRNCPMVFGSTCNAHLHIAPNILTERFNHLHRQPSILVPEAKCKTKSDSTT